LLYGDILQKKEAGLWDGPGSAPQIYGMYTRAQSLSTSTWTGPEIEQANVYDLALVMKQQIRKSYGSRFMPNAVVMNDGDALEAGLIKDDNGNYVRHPYLSPDGTVLGGMKVYTSPEVDTNTMLVGDFRYASLYLGDNVEIEIGYDGNDFTYDLFTIKARHRLALLIRTVDSYGFLKSTDVASDLGNITTSTA
jgi:HK97 family phage major capsid protein